MQPHRLKCWYKVATVYNQETDFMNGKEVRKKPGSIKTTGRLTWWSKLFPSRALWLKGKGERNDKKNHPVTGNLHHRFCTGDDIRRAKLRISCRGSPVWRRNSSPTGYITSRVGPGQDYLEHREVRIAVLWETPYRRHRWIWTERQKSFSLSVQR